MRSYAREVAAVFLLCGLSGCADGSLSTLPDSSSTAHFQGVTGDSIPVVDDPGEPSDEVNAGECTLVRVQDGTAEGSWESICDGISGGSILPPPPPPPSPPSFPPPSDLPGNTGDGTVGSPDQTNPVCAFAVGLAIGLKFQDDAAQGEYQAAYDAYMKKYAEHTAWDNQAKADGVYTWPEQAKLYELGDQLRILESTMKAAKESYDNVHKALIAAEVLVGVSCVFV